MNIILWRHAEAEDIAPDSTDAGRRLTAKGEKQAKAMSQWLHQHLPADTVILASPAVRTQQTASALGREYKTDLRLFTDTGVEAHIEAIRAQTAASILIVGHQPTLGQLAALLLCGQPQPWSVKKGAIWWLSATAETQTTRLVCMLDPKHL